MDAALARIEALMDAEAATPEGDELDVLTDLVEHYEEKHVPMGFPSPVAAIEFRLEQAGLAPRDLIPFIGSRAKVSEVLSGKRPLTMPMARALHEHLGIPAAVLLQQPGADFDTEIETLEWDRFPIKSMVKAGWIPTVRNLSARSEELVRDLIKKGEDAAEINRGAKVEGMESLRESALRRLAEGLTTYEEGVRSTSDMD